MMKKLFVLLIKYMPTIQLVGMLVNNTLYKYDVNLEFDYIGNGTIRVKIPLIDKVIELDTNDLTAFKETLTSK